MGSMEQGSVSCNFLSAKMAKVKRVIDDARDAQNPELDLVDKGIASFEEMPGLCEFLNRSTWRYERSLSRSYAIIKDICRLQTLICQC